MNTLSLEATSDLLATATITQTIDMGLFIAHQGIAGDGTAFVLVNGGTDSESVLINLSNAADGIARINAFFGIPT